VRVWNVRTGQELFTLREPIARPVGIVAFGRRGEFLAASTDNGGVLVWDLRGALQQPPDVVFKPTGRAVHALWVGADRSTVARAWSDGAVECQGPTVGRPLFLPGQEQVHNVALDPEGRTVAWAVNDGSVRLWILAERKQRGHFRVLTGRVRCMVFSPGGDRVAFADESPALKIWDTTTGHELARVEGHQGPVLALAWAAGGRLLASGGEDRTVRVWDVQTAEQRASLSGHAKPVCSVAVAPDGRFLASAGADGTVNLWTSTPSAGARRR
jgi:WD40 repeat protein